MMRWSLILGLLFLAFVPTALTAAHDPLSVAEVLGVRLVSEGSPASFSLDGRRVAYAVRKNLRDRGERSRDLSQMWLCSGLVWYGMASDILVTDVVDGHTTNITGGERDNWLPAWSPDGKYVAFLSDRDGTGSAKLWVWESMTGRLRKISEAIIRAQRIEWTSDSREIITTVRPEELDIDSARACQPSPDTRRPSDVLVYESALLARTSVGSQNSDPWSLNPQRRDLALFNVQSGEMKLLTHARRIEWFELSPDSMHVALTVPLGFEGAGLQQIRYDLEVVNLHNGERLVVAPSIRLHLTGRAVAWSHDSAALFFQTGGPLARDGDLYRADADGSGVRRLTSFSGEGHSPDFAPVVDRTGQHVYFIRDGALWETAASKGHAGPVARISGHAIVRVIADRGQLISPSDSENSILVMTQNSATKEDGFYSVDLATHASRVLLEGGWSYSRDYQQEQVVVSKEGKSLIFAAQNSQHPTDLWIADLRFRCAHRLTHLNPNLDAHEMGKAELVHWHSLDGDELSGALLLPSHYVEGARYPLIVWLYGGRLLSEEINNFGIVGAGEPYNLQMFATRGYAILAPDAPLHLGTPMLDLAKTVLPGIEKIVETGIADPKRIGLMGQSYGGYSVVSLLVQSTLFKAAVVGGGFGDLIGYYGEMDIDGSAYGTAITETGQGLMGGEPWKYRDRYVENSPVFYLDRVETPLLILHGGADTTVAPFLADELFVMLRRLGKQVAYAKYVGEDHVPSSWSPENQADLGDRVIDWFNRWLETKIEATDEPRRVVPSEIARVPRAGEVSLGSCSSK